MYFNSRQEAGEKLAKVVSKSKKLGGELSVVALSEGSVVVAKPVAAALHAPLSLLVSRPLTLPAVAAETIGSVIQDGSFVPSDELSEGEAEELQSEFRGYIEEEKIRQMHGINQLMNEAGIVSPAALRGHTVVAVSDGLSGPAPLGALAAFLKPIHISGLIAAVPVASVQAVDKMHILFDELHCLHVTDNYLKTDHYYNGEVAPDHAKAMALLQAAG